MLKAKVANNFKCLYISCKASNHFAHWAKPDYNTFDGKHNPLSKSPIATPFKTDFS
jgi:hypothetical protein